MVKHGEKAWKNHCESVTFLKILIDQLRVSKQRLGWQVPQGLYVNIRGPEIICKCPVSKYFKVINHIHDLLSQICPILLPAQLSLFNNELNLGFLGSRFCPRVRWCWAGAGGMDHHPHPQPKPGASGLGASPKGVSALGRMHLS